MELLIIVTAAFAGSLVGQLVPPIRNYLNGLEKAATRAAVSVHFEKAESPNAATRV